MPRKRHFRRLVAVHGTIAEGGEAVDLSDETRVDRWLCAVRLVKTRPMATQLCDGGHVRVNGNPAKPSTKVRATDVVHALIAERERIVEVVRPIETRVGAPVAATCYIDSSPPPVVREIAPGIKAVRGEGRPSKRLRRELDRMRLRPGGRLAGGPEYPPLAREPGNRPRDRDLD